MEPQQAQEELNEQEFNQRLSQWVASQGFWFQLRHSLSGSGGGVSMAMFHFVRMLFRVLIFAALLGIGFFVYLHKRIDSGSFRVGLKKGVTESLGASEAEVSGFRRLQGKAMLRRIGATGSSESFFESLEASHLTMDMGLLDGVVTNWDAGVVECHRLDVELKAGANSSEEATTAAGLFFDRHPKFLLRGVTAAAARISWGYFERAYGGIAGSKLIANRVGDGWRFTFEGGTFSQNWIRDFQIDELVIYCDRDGMVVEKGRLSSGGGTVVFRDVKATGGERPELSGSLLFSEVPLDELVPENAAEIVGGSLSGEFELSGSTNSAEGVSMEGRVTLGGGDLISVRGGFPLFESLDVVDVFNGYHRVDFDSGGFNMRTNRGVMELSQLDLEATGLLNMQGRITVRRPKEDELERLIGATAGGQGFGQDLGVAKENELTMTLKRAAEANSDEDDENAGESAQQKSFFSSMEVARRLRRDQMERVRRIYVFEGGVRMMIPGDAFERSRTLRERFPVDQATGQIGIDVPFEGTLGEITADLAEEILRLGRQD